MRTLCLLVPLATFALISNVNADWNQFRGPTGDGQVTSNALPIQMGTGKNVTWKVDIEGKAWSSPVLQGDSIWITNAHPDGSWLDALCFSAKDGSVLHKVRVFENEDPQFCHSMNSYATPTPVIADGRVYVHFGVHGTAALDANTAEILWTRRDLKCNHFRGPASSPTVWKQHLYLTFDGFDVQYVVALDTETGKTLWKHSRAFDHGTDNGDRKKAYATPAVFEIDGRQQLICPSAVATESLDAKTGEPIWHVYHGGMNASCRPIYAHGLLFITQGSGGIIAVDPANGTGDITKSGIVWKSSKSIPKKSSPVLVGPHLFMINDSGVASCLVAKTGEVLWTARVGGDFAASPVTDGKHIWFFSRDGDAPVIKVGTEYELVAENKFDSGFMASPAVVGDALILRTVDSLMRIEQN